MSIVLTVVRLVSATTTTATPESQKSDSAPESGEGGRHWATVFLIVSLVETSTT